MKLIIMIISLSVCFAPCPILADPFATRDASMERFLHQVLEANGLRSDIKVLISSSAHSCAYADIIDGQQMIFIDPNCVGPLMTRTGYNWRAVSILAHEVSHLLSGHCINGRPSNHAEELAADEYSGWIAAQLGASLAEAQSSVSGVGIKGNSTHPGRAKRLAAVYKGWRRAKQARTSNDEQVQHFEAPADEFMDGPGGSGTGNRFSPRMVALLLAITVLVVAISYRVLKLVKISNGSAVPWFKLSQNMATTTPPKQNVLELPASGGARETLGASAQSPVVDPVKVALGEIYTEGYQTGHSGGMLVPDADREEILSEWAEGRIREMHEGPLRPSESPLDKVLIENLDRARRRESRAESAFEAAQAAAREAQAALPAVEPHPRVSTMAVFCGVCFLALCFALNLAETRVLHFIVNEQQRLIYAFALGLIIAGTVAGVLYGLKVNDEQHVYAFAAEPKYQLWQLLSSLALIVGFATLRLSAARTNDHYWMVGAIALIEFAAMAYLKSDAQRHFQAVCGWMAGMKDYRKRLLDRDATATEQTSSDQERSTAKAERVAASRAMDERLMLDFDVEIVSASAISAVRQGYRKAIDENNGAYCKRKSA